MMGRQNASDEWLDLDGFSKDMTDRGIPTTERQAYRLLTEEGFPGVKIRGKWFIRRSAVGEHLARIERTRNRGRAA
jgi:hypothetical protein